jgi:hypothetical protein
MRYLLFCGFKQDLCAISEGFTLRNGKDELRIMSKIKKRIAAKMATIRIHYEL